MARVKKEIQQVREEKTEPSAGGAKDVTAELVTIPENGLTPEEEELRKELETQVV